MAETLNELLVLPLWMAYRKTEELEKAEHCRRETKVPMGTVSLTSRKMTSVSKVIGTSTMEMLSVRLAERVVAPSVATKTMRKMLRV